MLVAFATEMAPPVQIVLACQTETQKKMSAEFVTETAARAPFVTRIIQ